jgi:hypothetical protein
MAVRTEEKIEAVAEPLGCFVGDLIGPSSAYGYLPFRSSGLFVDGHDATAPTAGSHQG